MIDPEDAEMGPGQWVVKGNVFGRSKALF